MVKIEQPPEKESNDSPQVYCMVCKTWVKKVNLFGNVYVWPEEHVHRPLSTDDGGKWNKSYIDRPPGTGNGREGQ